jgi:hypothetical protein
MLVKTLPFNAWGAEGTLAKSTMNNHAVHTSARGLVRLHPLKCMFKMPGKRARETHLPVDYLGSPYVLIGEQRVSTPRVTELTCFVGCSSDVHDDICGCVYGYDMKRH